MAAILQNDAGTVEDANAYIDFSYLRLYATQRGVLLTQLDPALDIACIKATEYMDFRWFYNGEPRVRSQTTQFPRQYLEDRYGNDVNVLPAIIQKVCAEYALIYLTQGHLVANPERDGTGIAVLQRTEKVGPISESTLYKGGGFEMPKYPAPDRMINATGFVQPNGSFQRG